MDIVAATETSEIEQIRNLVSIAYDATALTNTTIAQDVFLGDANLEMKEKVPNWETIMAKADDDDDKRRLKIGTMKLTARNILVAYARLRREGADDLSEERDQLTPSQAIKRYENDVGDIVKKLNPTSTSTAGRYIVAGVVV